MGLAPRGSVFYLQYRLGDGEELDDFVDTLDRVTSCRMAIYGGERRRQEERFVEFIIALSARIKVGAITSGDAWVRKGARGTLVAVEGPTKGESNAAFLDARTASLRHNLGPRSQGTEGRLYDMLGEHYERERERKQARIGRRRRKGRVRQRREETRGTADEKEGHMGEPPRESGDADGSDRCSDPSTDGWGVDAFLDLAFEEVAGWPLPDDVAMGSTCDEPWLRDLGDSVFTEEDVDALVADLGGYRALGLDDGSMESCATEVTSRELGSGSMECVDPRLIFGAA